MEDRFTDWTWTIYIPHAQRLCEDSETEALPERFQPLDMIGLCFAVDGKSDEAVKTHSEAVPWREMDLKSSEQKVSMYNSLGEVLAWRGCLPAAKKCKMKGMW